MPIDENNWMPAVALGSSLIILACCMMWSHNNAWRRQQQDLDEDDTDRAYYFGRYRRRMQTSGFLAIVGFLIGVGDIAIWRFGPFASAIFWLMIIVFAGWIGLLALGDLTAVRTHSQIEMAKHEAQRRVLERELQELRKGSNGRPVQ